MKRAGVVSVDVSPGDEMETIHDNVFRAISGGSPFGAPKGNALRVLSFYRLFSLGGRPTVVLQVRERSDTKPYAHVLGTARYLAGLGMAVIVDAADNSLNPADLGKARQDMLEVEALTIEDMEKIYEPLFDVLRKEDLVDGVWAVLGGVPVSFDALQRKLAENIGSPVRQTVKQFLGRTLTNAASKINDGVKANPELKGVLEQLKVAAAVPDTLTQPSKVLRRATISDKELLVPASPAIAFVIRHGHTDERSFEELCALANNKRM